MFQGRMLKRFLSEAITSHYEQGHDVEGFEERLEKCGDSLDALNELAQQLAGTPMRKGWPYVEPDSLSDIWEECDPSRPSGPIGEVDLKEASTRIEAAFLGSVCGCILGKPLEIRPTLDEIRQAAQSVGEWPLNDYIPQSLMNAIGRHHRSLAETVREKIRYVAPDDDLNYTVMGMLILEKAGIDFTKKDVAELWLLNLPALWTFGPERTIVAKCALHEALSYGASERLKGLSIDDLAVVWNPRNEYCGAQIRADAYGYACPARPELAAELAWRDATLTHRKTGVYGTMFVAAALACASVMKEPSEIFDTALKFIPRRSRFYKITADAMDIVSKSQSWLEAYGTIHERYEEYGHCRIFQETGTLINTVCYAKDVGDGICIQVMQGNDTDSYGATAGSLLGAHFGPGHLEERWLKPFNDTIHVALAGFYEQSLSALAKRMGKLPTLVEEALKTKKSEG